MNSRSGEASVELTREELLADGLDVGPSMASSARWFLLSSLMTLRCLVQSPSRGVLTLGINLRSLRAAQTQGAWASTFEQSMHSLEDEMAGKSFYSEGITATARAYLNVFRLEAGGVSVSERSDDDLFAYAVGESDGTRARGRIELTWGLIHLLTAPETKFVLAHECAHIAYNHSATRAVWRQVRAVADEASKTTPSIAGGRVDYDLANLWVNLTGGLNLPAFTLRQQELEADYVAVQIVAAAEGWEIPFAASVAESALLKLALGDLTAPSHTWEALGIHAPVMTVEDRLSELKQTCGVA